MQLSVGLPKNMIQMLFVECIQLVRVFIPRLSKTARALQWFIVDRQFAFETLS